MSAEKSKAQFSRFTQADKPARLRQGLVLHLTSDFEIEDPAREIVDLGIQCQRSNWPVMIASGGGGLVRESERAAIAHHEICFRRQGVFHSWRHRAKLEELFQKIHPRIVHVHGFDALPYAYNLCRQHALPMVADFTQPYAIRTSERAVLHDIIRQRALIRVPTEYMGRIVHDEWGIAPDKIYHVPTGLDTKWYSTGSVSRERLSSLARQWRLPEQGAIVLVPLPLIKGMGHETILHAVEALADDSLFLVFVGHDRDQPGQRTLIENSLANHRLMGRVSMPESCPDWPAAFWHASAVVLPNTVARGSCREVLAAQAMGRPVVVTDCGANRELVDSTNHWVVAPDRIDALGAALKEVLNLDTNHRLAQAERSREFVMKHYSQQAWLHDMLGMYETLTTQAPRLEKPQVA